MAKAKIISTMSPIDDNDNKIDGPTLLLVQRGKRLFVETEEGQKIAERIRDGKGGGHWQPLGKVHSVFTDEDIIRH